ncbi:sensor histidine kinase [Sphingobacterium sp. SGR-19]|uniref:sensor histidine kinase n=1 Tax=Sphingobacterium sp. SGR-19 TaxID=2710886 RepID=UPI0013EDEB10|nr:histidine kinase [Sphingobacterium sp. SGR-19]NGM64389.1 sensor histidine kinase [Sphingobacterium sp. SGR-19]
MKTIVFTFLSFIITLSTVRAQKGINFYISYDAGGRLTMHVDSAANNVYYGNKFPNQPNTSFNYLPEVNHVSVQMYFQKTENPQNYRYTILADDEPIAVNKPINKEELKDVIRKDHEWKDEVLDSTTLGVFPIKGKTITILTYDIQRPQDVYENVFYGKSIPRPKIEIIAKRFATEKGIDYTRIIRPKERIDLTFTEKDDELTIIKDKTYIDYIYSTSIKDKKTDKIIFESTSWLYGGYLNEEGNKYLPHVKVDKSIFKKSGDYEIIIQPKIRWDISHEGIFDYDISPQEIEKYTARYTLAITLDQESYTKKEAFIYTLIITFSLGFVFLVIFYFTRKRNKKKLAEQEQQKNIAKLQLNSICSQLNPHFLFNALSGIQNLMNKNETDNANKYLSKFARLTRNVLDYKELISLSQEKNLLDDYLQMEQLRFGFQYEINHSEDLDLANIEIPSMLLQPFVENAVKHGISQQATAGKIVIEFMKQADDLVLTVTDNGNGFDTGKRYPGLGLQLSDSRIALLNSIYKENRFILATQSSDDGTKIGLTLTDWL